MKNLLGTCITSGFIALGCSTPPATTPEPPLAMKAAEQSKPSAPPEPIFQHPYGDGKTPWTKKPFQNDPQEFQFAIVSDRTGGPRAGVFEKAVEKINLLHPEFVMSVGDLINGYIEDKSAVESEWREFDEFLRPLDMPFFYVAGNHDVFDEQSARIWEEKFGVRYYAFLYKNVLFLCLDSQENEQRSFRGGLSAEQVKWAEQVLQRHDQVRWTLLFMHQPLWLYEETGHRHEKPYETGFKQVEQALGARPYTVFAGHFHRYTKYQRHERNYYILGTTGGGSSLRGANHGEFDHGVWVTMTHKGPKVANLALDGIKSDTVFTEKMKAFEESFAFSKSPDSERTELVLRVANPFSHPLAFNLQWHSDATSTWTISPRVVEGKVKAGEAEEVRISFSPGKSQFPMPEARLQLQAGDEYSGELSLASTSLLFTYERSRLTARPIPRPPIIDGLLDEKLWQKPPLATAFRHHQSLKLESAKTKVWASYDATSLYLAFDCAEPKMNTLALDSEKRDPLKGQDDSVEILLRPDLSADDYYQIILNAAGSILDGKGKDSSYNLEFTSKTHLGEKGWTAEIAIPWTTLGIAEKDLGKLRPGRELGLLLGRIRPSTEGVLQFPPMNTSNHNPERFGILQLGR